MEPDLCTGVVIARRGEIYHGEEDGLELPSVARSNDC